MHATADQPPARTERQSAMRLLALASAEALEQAYAGFDFGDWTFVRRPETGMVMTRGRIGGGGAPFNLGEMSVTRAAVRLSGGDIGHAYVAGRNQRKAAICAVFDAALQSPHWQTAIARDVLAPLAAQLEADRTVRARRAAATKVDFFTLVRGDD